MIRYTLKCEADHAFESWFRSAAAFDALAARSEVRCPECGSDEVAKAPMAPRVASERKSRDALLSRLRQEVEEKSDYVGGRFASEARAIHEGTADARSIWGEARSDEARKLVEDGIPVLPLPFVPQRKMN